MDSDSEESRSSSILDSDIEEGLYSQIYHDHNREQGPTTSEGFNFSFSLLSSSEVKFTVHEQSVLPSNVAKIQPKSPKFPEIATETKSLKSNAIKKQAVDVIDIESSDDCEVIGDDFWSKYTLAREKPPEPIWNNDNKKRKVEEVILSDDDYDATNLYIHVDRNNTTKNSVETIYLSDSDHAEASTSQVHNAITIGSSNATPQKVLTSTPKPARHVKFNGKRPLSFLEFLEQKMNNYYTYDTLSDISQKSSQEIITSLGGVDDDWFVSIVDRRLSANGKRRSGRKDWIICNNCRQRGHIAVHCPDPKKQLICSLCGGNHLEPECYKRSCDICWKNGHVADNCRNKQKLLNMKCSICKCYGHSAKYCPDLWRKYHLSTQPGPPVISHLSLKSTAFAFCPNCAQKGHFVHECEDNLMNENIYPNRQDIVSYSGILATPVFNRIQPPKEMPQTSWSSGFKNVSEKGEIIRISEEQANNITKSRKFKGFKKKGFKKSSLHPMNNQLVNSKIKSKKYNRFKKMYTNKEGNNN